LRGGSTFSTSQSVSASLADRVYTPSRPTAAGLSRSRPEDSRALYSNPDLGDSTVVSLSGVFSTLVARAVGRSSGVAYTNQPHNSLDTSAQTVSSKVEPKVFDNELVYPCSHHG